MRRIAAGIALGDDGAAEVSYTRAFVPLVNDAALVEQVLDAARAVSDPGAVRVAAEPMTASEDFARFLAYVPGCFAFIGNGEASAPLHNPTYDFIDEALVHGLRLQAAIVRCRLRVA